MTVEVNEKGFKKSTFKMTVCREGIRKLNSCCPTLNFKKTQEKIIQYTSSKHLDGKKKMHSRQHRFDTRNHIKPN